MEDEGKLNISALAFIRGRSLSNVIFIVDEAQNLTPMKKQLSPEQGRIPKSSLPVMCFKYTPYLDEQSNGLSFN